jgi:hypothetical protein
MLAVMNVIELVVGRPKKSYKIEDNPKAIRLNFFFKKDSAAFA